MLDTDRRAPPRARPCMTGPKWTLLQPVDRAFSVVDDRAGHECCCLRSDQCAFQVHFWLGISTSSDTSSEPPISRKGQVFAIDSAASMELASTMV